MSEILCVILVIAVAVQEIRLHLVHKAAEQIRKQLPEKLHDDTNTTLLLSSRDKQMCRLAEDINEQLRILREQKRRFDMGDWELKNAVSGISHDLRTPLTAISGYLDLLEKTKMGEGESAERYIRIIRDRTEAMKQLTEELFCYSVITSPEYDTATEPTEVNGVLEESIAAFYAALQKKGITPKLEITSERVVRNINRAALLRVFSNLFQNAIKYSDGDLEIVMTDAGEITFSNMALGLSEVQVERFFDRFYTVENARKSTGLGLSIAKALLGQMGGEITAKYSKGRLYVSILLPPLPQGEEGEFSAL